MPPTCVEDIDKSFLKLVYALGCGQDIVHVLIEASFVSYVLVSEDIKEVRSRCYSLREDLEPELALWQDHGKQVPIVLVDGALVVAAAEVNGGEEWFLWAQPLQYLGAAFIWISWSP